MWAIQAQSSASIPLRLWHVVILRGVVSFPTYKVKTLEFTLLTASVESGLIPAVTSVVKSYRCLLPSRPV